MVVRRHVVAHGRVQGVFFRESVRRAAESRGVAGWARNRPDGTVEVVLEGAPDAVEAMVEECRRGPGHATVERLELTEQPPEALEGFEVR